MVDNRGGRPVAQHGEPAGLLGSDGRREEAHLLADLVACDALLARKDGEVVRHGAPPEVQVAAELALRRARVLRNALEDAAAAALTVAKGA